ncbi:PucR family transcriptional regulator [Bacillaceae bacterium W0354]
MNIEKLKAIFPQLIELEQQDTNYFTFTYEEKLYGIPKSKLNDEQRTLLEAVTEQLPAHTTEEQQWLSFLTKKQTNAPKKLKNYRFIFIKFNQPLQDVASFRESLQQILNKKIIFLWDHFAQVTLLEEIKQPDETINFTEIIDVMSEDLDTNMKLYISDIEHDLTYAPTLYLWMQQTASTIWKFSNNRITEQKDSIIPMITHLFKQQDQNMFIKSILKDSTQEPELLETIKAVIECHGNVSLTAKQLYMHRNSVQYRIDKFYEMTGNDLRQFSDSIRVYLAILLYEAN